MHINAIASPDPIDPYVAAKVAVQLIPELIAEDGVAVNQLLTGTDLETELQALMAETSTEEGMKSLLDAAVASSKQYHDSWLIKTAKGKK